MAKQIEGVYERTLGCAKKEFLEKGHTGASLRTIASKADTSTNYKAADSAVQQS